MIWLIGPGGAGKSTAGPLLARRLGLPFRDLDVEFAARFGDIDGYIAAHGYAAYARANVEAYAFVAEDGSGGVMALSSGFMTYPPEVHPGYAAIRDEIARSGTTFVLLPSLDRAACVAETVRRQMARPLTRRSPVREEQVIRERFPIYISLPARKVETMRPPAEVAADIAERLSKHDPAALMRGRGFNGQAAGSAITAPTQHQSSHHNPRRSRMENVRETEEYILVEHASGSGRTFEVGYPKRSGYSRKGIEEEIAHARERRGTEASPDSATYHSLEWAADGASTTTREAISAGLIGGHVDKVSGATYEYQLTFANRSGWSFTFVDLTGDTYTCTTLRNGTHTISYNSAKPTIVGVQ